MNRLKAALPLMLLFALGAALYLSGALDMLAPENVVAQQTRLQAMIADWPWLSRLVLVGLMTLGVATGIPGCIVLVLAAGFLFGTVEATLYTGIGLLLGSLLLFLASRKAFRSGQRSAPDLVERIRSSYLDHPLSYTFFVRLMPVFPYGAITIALAWLRCPLWMFLLASSIGGTITLAFECAVGSSLAHHLASGKRIGFSLLLEPSVILPLLALALLALVPAAFNWHADRRSKSRQINP